MAKKGKEIELGSLRIQIDPFILARRVLMRQKVLLAVIAVVGGALTIYLYKNEPKIYRSNAQIAVRTENMDGDFARKFINRAMRELNSNEETMLIINELDLFSSTRVAMPYTIALRRMRRELFIKNSQGSIEIGFESKNPSEAQRVAAFVTERTLSTLERLLDSPYTRQLDALDRAIAELTPKVEAARTRLFEFKARHPSIAIRQPDFIPADSPLAEIQDQIKRAEESRRACYGGSKPIATRRPPTNGPRCRALTARKRELTELQQKFTPNHPSVIAMEGQVAQAERACEAEQDATMGGLRPGMSQAECIDASQARIKSLQRRKVDIEKKAIRKPRLQQEWAELSLEVNQYESQLRSLQERRARTEQDRVMGSSNFQDNFQLVDAPRLPELPAKPDRNRFLMVGIAITAILGLAIALLREALRQSFLDAKEFEEQTGLSVLAVLPDIQERTRST